MAKLNVNGQTGEVEADDETPLLWVIASSWADRHQVGLWCRRAARARCTSTGWRRAPASLPVSAVAKQRIVTIEGFPRRLASCAARPGSRSTCRSAATASRA